jgi:hypothetical protein
VFVPRPGSLLSRTDRPAVRIAVTTALIAGGLVPLALATAVSSAATAPTATTSYQPGVAQLATITNGTATAPWNEWQGDPATAAYSTVGSGTVLPTYTPGGAMTGTGATAEPNLSVMSGSGSGTAGVSPYPSGTVGTPGPLDGYCGTGDQGTESGGTPARQPVGSTLPLAPAYFPRVIDNGDGSLTGYFDYRPKDADEAIVAARSTNGGKSWTYLGQALEQNPGYCPSSDINDDGQGHPFVLQAGGATRLYTLQRSAGDSVGVGLTAHTLSMPGTDPLAGVPATEKVGIDPNVSVTGGTSIPSTAPGSTITITTMGATGTLEAMLPGGFVDITQTPTPTHNSVINCTGVSPNSLTGCTSAGVTSVGNHDVIEQVIGFVGTAATVPAGPNISTGAGGIGVINVVTAQTGGSAGFTNSQTGTLYNNLAPNRAYIDGVAVYCNQANANPTTKMEDCTTGPGGATLNVSVGDPITSDPIIPSTASQTSGLVAPDGIVGVLPTYPGAPSNAVTVLYTEKIVNYYVAGTTTNGSSTAFTSSIVFNPSPSETLDMPSTISTANPVTVSMGDSTANKIVQITCTGLTVTTTTDTLTGCAGFTAGDKYSSTSLIGAPGATTVPQATLGLTGQGSSSTAKLFKNNEDLTVLRVAWTTDGLNFFTTGLDNNGVISGQSAGAASYSDITNPSTTTSPSNLNAYATPGTQLDTEMRYIGSGGSIITNPDGSIGLFLSGAWAADGDSDAFNQIFYTQSTDGEHWSIPTSLVSTDYTFSASVAQDAALGGGTNQSLGISAYYSGRAYGPSIIQNANGTLTMLFAGYRIPKTIATAGTVLGTSGQYTVGAQDPTAYRNILVETLTETTTPKVSTTMDLIGQPSAPVAGGQVTYYGIVHALARGVTVPTGTVTFTGNSGTLCSAVPLRTAQPIQASCTVPYATAQTDSVTATYSGDGNYATSNVTISETIGLQPNGPLSVSAPATGTYGGSDTVSATGGAASPPITFSADPASSGVCSVSGNTVSYLGVGSCVVHAAQAADGVHAAASGQATIDVGAAPLTITASSTSTGYGQAPATITPGYSGFVNGDGASALTPGPSCSTPVTAATHVGSYASSCSGALDPNYTISYVDGTVAVTPATLTVTASSPTVSYGTGATVTAGYSGFVNGDDASALPTAPSCSTTATASSPVGSYPSSCSGGVATDYTFSYVPGSVTVAPVALTITASSTSTTYGVAPGGITPSYSGFVNGDDASAVTTAPICSTAVTASTHVGSYASTCSGAVAGNYTIGYVDGTVVVNPASLTVTASSTSTTYGVAPGAITASYAGFVNGDDASALTTAPTCSTGVTAATHVGSYASTCFGAVDADYLISYVDGTVGVTPAALTVTASSTSTTYGVAPGGITASYSGFVNGDDASALTTTPTCSAAVTATTGVGTYPSSCTGTSATDYTITEHDGQVVVNPAPLSVVASSPSMTYGGAVPAITASYLGFVNGDTAAVLTATPTCSTTALPSSPVGAYPSSCSGAAAANYTVNNVGGTVTVGAATLTITASGGSMVYGGTVPTITPSFAGFVNGDTAAALTPGPSCSANVTATSPVGTYASSCSGALDSNYDIHYVAGKMKVTKAPLKITASNGAMVFGQTPPAITASYAGFVNGETSTVLSTAPTCSTGALSTSPVGTYPSRCSGAVAANYAITYATGTVTISRAGLTVTAAAISYAAAAHAHQVTFSATVTNASTGAAAKGVPVTFTVNPGTPSSFGCTTNVTKAGIAKCASPDVPDLAKATPGSYLVTIPTSTNYLSASAVGAITS